MITNAKPGEPIVKLTPDEFAEMIRQQKPYLMELEERAEKIGYGTIIVEITVRAKVVEKMEFIESKQIWMKPKS